MDAISMKASLSESDRSPPSPSKASLHSEYVFRLVSSSLVLIIVGFCHSFGFFASLSLDQVRPIKQSYILHSYKFKLRTFVSSFMKISQTVCKLWSVQDFVPDRWTDRRTVDQGKNNMSLDPEGGSHKIFF